MRCPYGCGYNTGDADALAEHMYRRRGSDGGPRCSPDLLPVEIEQRLRAKLAEQHVLDRAAAPDPEDVIATMRANGLHDPERE